MRVGHSLLRCVDRRTLRYIFFGVCVLLASAPYITPYSACCRYESNLLTQMITVVHNVLVKYLLLVSIAFVVSLQLPLSGQSSMLASKVCGTIQARNAYASIKQVTFCIALLLQWYNGRQLVVLTSMITHAID